MITAMITSETLFKSATKIVVLSMIALHTACKTADELPAGRQSSIVVSAPVIKDFPSQGWRMFAVPTTGNPVGSIFTSDRDGTIVPVDAIRHMTIETNLLELPEILGESSRSIEIAVLFRHLFDNAAVSLNTSNMLTGSIKVKLKLAHAIEERVLARNASHALASTGGLFDADVLLRRGNPLFIILGTIKVKSMEWEFDREELKRLGLEASLAEWVKLTPGAKWTSSMSTAIRREFPNEMRIFYLPYMIGTVRDDLNFVRVLPISDKYLETPLEPVKLKRSEE
jgi:hypothetical protein